MSETQIPDVRTPLKTLAGEAARTPTNKLYSPKGQEDHSASIEDQQEVIVPTFAVVGYEDDGSPKHVAGWPAHAKGTASNDMLLGAALTIRHADDRYLLPYHATHLGRRINKDFVKHPHNATLPKVEMALRLADFDCHGLEGEEREDWRHSTREKVNKLLAAHPGGYFFETNGGARPLYLSSPFSISSREDQEAWKRQMHQWSAYMLAEFGLVNDPATAHFNCYFRLPWVKRLKRDKQTGEMREVIQNEMPFTIGDAYNVSTWEGPIISPKYVEQWLKVAREEVDREKGRGIKYPAWGRVVTALSPPKPKPAYTPPPASIDSGRYEKWREVAIAEDCAALAAMPEDSGRNNCLFERACSLSEMYGMDLVKLRDRLESAALSSGLDENEIEDVIDSAFNTTEGNEKRHPKDRDAESERVRVLMVAIGKKNGQSAKTPDAEGLPKGGKAEPEQHSVFTQNNDKGKPLAILDNVCNILANDPNWQGVLAFDEFNGRVVCRKPPPWDRGLANMSTVKPGQSWSDGDDGRLVRWLSSRANELYRMHIKEPLARTAVIQEALRHTFHPVREFLSSLKWDGVQRIDTWLITYLGVEDTKYTRAVGAKWLISMMARIMIPGCQAKYALILEGPQDLGKSALIRDLVGAEWFTDQLPPDIGSADAALQLLGVWVLEFAELEALTKADAAKAKAFISRQVDKYRAPYARTTESHPRQCVFFGTTNESQYSKDATGAVRYWPVACIKADREGIALAREQLLAEALHRFYQKEEWHLTDQSVIAEAREEQAARLETHPWTKDVQEYLDSDPDRKTNGVDIVDVILGKKLRMFTHEVTQRDKNDVGRILRALGWEYGRAKKADDSGSRPRKFFKREPSTS